MLATSPSKIFVTLGIAGLKRAKSWLRADDAIHPQWQVRAVVCSRCPLVFVQCGKSYCGKPLLRQLEREEATDGCGCPVNLKARDPSEHCPRNADWETSSKGHASTCDCVWCAALRSDQRSSTRVA